MTTMIPEIRCYNCNALLARQFDGSFIEIKCRRCKHINKIANHTGLPPAFPFQTLTKYPVVES